MTHDLDIGNGPSNRMPYDTAWYANRAALVRRSAEIVLPSAFDLLESCGWIVRSAVDVGAGTGDWLAVARKRGVEEVLAIEGEWVRGLDTGVPESAYLFADVGEALDVPRRFDLAISLEVAEHLAPEQAPRFVDNIAQLANVILFSAAIPRQGGANHVNEQWPGYWSRHFDARGFGAYDILRWRLWHDDRIAFWYRQNLLLFVHRDLTDLRNALEALPWMAILPDEPLPVVHPSKYESLLRLDRAFPARELLQALPPALWRALAWRLRRLVGGR